MGDKKKGRPTNNPKGEWTGVRLDYKSLLILNEYCKINNVTKSEAIRQAVYLLEDKLSE